MNRARPLPIRLFWLRRFSNEKVSHGAASETSKTVNSLFTKETVQNVGFFILLATSSIATLRYLIFNDLEPIKLKLDAYEQRSEKRFQELEQRSEKLEQRAEKRFEGLEQRAEKQFNETHLVLVEVLKSNERLAKLEK